ncbi:MAG TPA: CHASE3 domain-containing protein [Planctomycetota bacterium]|nr:CHASE3 domain-containing protein [Planctomycetota bacterium]
MKSAILGRSAVRFAPSLVLLILVGALALRSTRQLVESSDWVAHTLKVDKVLADTLTEIQRIESGTRGYVATGVENYLQPFKSNKADLDKDIAELRELTGDNPKQQERIKTLSVHIHNKVEYNLELIRLRKVGDAKAALDKLATGAGRELMNQIRMVAEAITQDEDALLAKRNEDLNASIRQTNIVIVAGTLVAVGIWALAFVFMLRDVQQRLRAETERDRFFDLSRDMLCVAGFDGKFKRVNPAFVAALGHSPEEMLSEPFESFIHPDDLEPTRREVSRLSKGMTTVSFENRYRCADGSYKWLDWSATPAPKEGVIYAAARDTTERRRVNAALKEALNDVEQGRASLAAMLHAVSSGLLVTDLSHRVILMNKTAENLLGVSFTKAEGKAIEETLPDSVLPAHIAAALSAREDEARIETPAASPHHKFDVMLSGGDGRAARVARAGVSIVRDRNGEPTGVITALDDVTREREVDRMKTEFLSTAAHELRTPLTSIRGFSELLLTREMSEEKRKAVLATVNAQAANLANIVNDLLDLARIESGRGMVLKRSPTNLLAMANGVVESFSGRGGAHRYSVKSDDPEPVAFCDPQKIQQVLQNLLSNAAKYSPNGGEVRVVVSSEAGLLKIAVSDEGIGMSADQMARIFTKFYRADASNTAAEGTGLGMSIVKAIVEQHGGTIQVESALGKGTSVTFTLRKQEKGVSAQPPPSLSPEPRGAAVRRILVLEDDAAVASMMQFCFEHTGYQVHSTGNGKGFVELAARLKPDLICLDCILPDSDGFAIAKGLQQDARTCAIPFIFVTVRESERDRAKEYGARGFIAKPFTEEELVTMVKGIVEGAGARGKGVSPAW